MPLLSVDAGGGGDGTTVTGAKVILPEGSDDDAADASAGTSLKRRRQTKKLGYEIFSCSQNARMLKLLDACNSNTQRQ
jgi:hypothetical protein